MLCQHCHKNVASVRYAEVMDGSVTNLHLCQSCLKQRQGDEGTGFEMVKPAARFAEQQKSPVRPDGPTTDACETCGTTLQEMLDSSTVGCSDCYERFPKELESMLEGVHVGLAYRGKEPGGGGEEDARLRGELQAKRGLLKTALQMENYEEAASLRDDIQRLETELKALRAGAV